MPVYEFYCGDCHTIYSFLSQEVNTSKTPACPKCKKKKMKRQVSQFAISTGRSDDGPEDFPNLDDDAMEKAMMSLERDMQGMDEDDPRAMAKMMRKLSDATGMNFGEGMQEAMRRMEAGEDPDKVEEEMGDLLDDDDEMFGPGSVKARLRAMAARLNAPKIDDGLYDM